jgi:hypothetical protein
MAGNEDRKAELIAQLARARQQLDASGNGFRQAIDVPARVRRNFQNYAFAWIGGALLAGVVIAKIARRPRSPSSGKAKSSNSSLSKAGAAGLLVAATKFAFDILRPVLVKWLVSRATPFAENLMARYMPPSHAPRDGNRRRSTD